MWSKYYCTRLTTLGLRGESIVRFKDFSSTSVSWHIKPSTCTYKHCNTWHELSSVPICNFPNWHKQCSLCDNSTIPYKSDYNMSANKCLYQLHRETLRRHYDCLTYTFLNWSVTEICDPTPPRSASCQLTAGWLQWLMVTVVMGTCRQPKMYRFDYVEWVITVTLDSNSLHVIVFIIALHKIMDFLGCYKAAALSLVKSPQFVPHPKTSSRTWVWSLRGNGFNRNNAANQRPLSHSSTIALAVLLSQYDCKIQILSWKNGNPTPMFFLPDTIQCNFEYSIELLSHSECGYRTLAKIRVGVED